MDSLIELNAEYSCENFLEFCAKSHNVVMIINYSCYNYGWNHDVDTIIFLKFTNVEDFCDVVAKNCYNYMKKNNLSSFEFPYCENDNACFINLDCCRVMKIYNIPQDIIELHGELICEKINFSLNTFLEL